VLPFALPLWETDVTVRGALEQSIEASVSSLGTGSALVGGELSVDGRVAGPRVEYLYAARGNYQRGFDLALRGGAGPPVDYLDADGSASATWNTSARGILSLETQYSLATTSGIRASAELLERDPFTEGQRLEVAGGWDLTYTLSTSASSSLSVSGGYLGAGALSADVPAAVGVDSHEGHVELSWSRDLGPRDSITPDLRYVVTHEYHALQDAELHRGPADVHAATLAVSESHELAPRLTATVRGGFTVGSRAPALGARGAVVAPEAGLSLTWVTPRARITGRYNYGYTSLGPRIGYGQRHTGRVRITGRPVQGARLRDLMLTGVLRLTHGAAPLAEDVPASGAAKGTLSTLTFATGTKVEYPLVRGLAVTGGLDFQLVRGVVDRAPAGTGLPQMTMLVTFGIAGTLSTDKNRTVRRDPDAEQDQAGRARPQDPTPGDRREDRTRTYEEDQER
jgi:hypothetical protein